ncbi:MAG: hypothetical protein HWN81_14065 [Candidatus Lokiarchaeota archaeon]|nr:hypothetical protein [Candidatus Lokiarchaeota archaeon]
MSSIKKTNKIQVICPICKTKDLVGIPRSRLNRNSQLTTISIQKGLICPHHFQFFMDNQFQIRGYQKVDLELNQENSNKLKNGVKVFKLIEKKNNNLFKELMLEGDTVKYQPLNSDEGMEKSTSQQEIILKRKKMTPKEIYEEFWEFINDNNENFLEFINKDTRRKKSSIYSHMSECIAS